MNALKALPARSLQAPVRLPAITKGRAVQPSSSLASCKGPQDLIGSVANETIASPGLCLMNSNLLESIEGRL